MEQGDVKRHRNQPEGAPTGLTWDNFHININVVKKCNSLNKIKNSEIHNDINKWVEEKGKLFFIEESQLINTEGMTKLGKSPFGNHHRNKWFRCELQTDAS